MGVWDRYVLPNLISCTCSMKPIMKQREKVVPLATGRVLELGSGSGTNFRYYDKAGVERLFALEPSEGMMIKARRSAEKEALTDRIEFLQTGAEDVPLEADSIDTAVITFVLCTIPDWQAALSEVRRVLKPGGKVLFSEHGLSPDEKVSKWQHRIEPVWKKLAGGCHLTRNTPEMLAAEGFVVDNVEHMYLPRGPKVAGYVSWGSARAA